jgi:hypothetical protein
MTGVGKIIGGAIILLIGVIVSGWGLTINGIQTSNIQNCDSFTGHLDQSLNSEQADICAKAPMFRGISNATIIGGLVFAGVGVLLIVLGAIASTKRKQDIVDYIPSSVKQDNIYSNLNERAYCRYCGNQSDISAAYCSRCGRSSIQ